MKLFFNRAVLAVLAGWLIAVTASSAATVSNFFSFSPLSPSNTNGDGAAPMGGLVSDGVKLYGTAAHGGTNGIGTIFSVGINGHDFTNLHNFDVLTNGSAPFAGMALSNGVLYGTTRVGGTNGLGTIFSIGASGGGFAKLHDFGLRFTATDPNTGNGYNSGGAFPESDLVLVSNVLYGATEQGGGGGGGVLFRVGTDGSGFTVLHNFTGADGSFPAVHMVVLGTNLFGTTEFGGLGSSPGNGTIFRVSTDGQDFTNLYFFNGTNAALPQTGLVLSSNTLYGAAELGSAGQGGAPYGSIFKIDTNGSNFAIVYVFDPELNGNSPAGGFVISSNTIYGAEAGFDYYGGTVYSIKTDGTGYTNLTSFNSPGDPGDLHGVLWEGGNLFCVGSGGANDNGDVFEVALNPQVNRHLNIQAQGNSVVLTWSDSARMLYAAPSLTNAFTEVPGATSPYTNAITGLQQYFELK